MVSTISLNQLLVDGVVCQNPNIISWEALNDCTNITCKLEDGSIKVEVSEEEDCEQACIRLIIGCDDGCADCDPIEFTTCLCDTSNDCLLCEECIDGFCILKSCEELCDPDTGDCVGCLIDGDCLCDQLCVNNECQCPPGQVVNERGCCVDCLLNADCPQCEKCVGGACDPVICADGICDPLTYDCVECVQTSDCTEDNQCCVANICVCCNGFVLDDEGNCVPPPDCTTEADCPDCFVCIDNECVPQTCPPGFTINGDCECVRECNCVVPDCPSGQSCVQGEIGLCYCIETPCVGLCDTAEDCGTGCGCQDGECVDCSTLTCIQCATVTGCTCTDTVCEGNPCSGPCNTGEYCDPGCGCLQGECVPCDSVSCTTTPQCPNGCFCDDGDCASNPCAEVFCTQASDCGIGCGCSDDGLCVPCTSLPCVADICADTPGCVCNGTCQGDPNPDCVDDLSLTKIDGVCDLVGTYDSASCCLCEDITATVNLTTPQGSSGAGYNDYDFIVTLRKNGVLLSGTGIANELPNSGTFRIRLRDSLIEANPDTLQPIPGGATSIRELVVSANAAGLATIPMSIDNVEAVSLVQGDTTYLITNRTVRFETTANLTFPNECIYKLSTKTIYSWLAPFPFSAIPAVTYTLERLVNCRKPLFRFFRNAAEGNLFLNASNFLSVYADRVDADSYRYLLTGYTDLQYGLYYGLTTDCGCDQETVYSCFGTSDATPLVFCDPTGFEYTITDCGKTLSITNAVTITCDVYTAVGAPKPVYELLLNGVVVSTRTLGTAPSVGAVLYAALTEFTIADVITSIQLRIVGDECDDCTIDYVVDFPGLEVDMTISSQCSGEANATATVTVTGGTAPYAYDITLGVTSIESGVFPTAGTYDVPIPNVPGVYVVTITDDDACEETATATLVNEDLDIVIGTSCLTDQGFITITNNSVYNANVSITVIGNSTVNAGSSVSIPATTGSYTVTVTPVGAEECLVIEAVDIDCCTDTDLNNAGVVYSCATGFAVTGSQPGWTTIIRTDPGGVITVPGVGNNGLPPGNYLVSISNGSCEVILALTVPTCYVCVDDVCEAAELNLGSTLAVCETDCGDCDTCDLTTLYIYNRILSIRVAGVDQLIGASVGATCTVGGSVVQIGNLTTALNNFFNAQGDCGTPSVLLDCVDVPVDPEILDPNECLPLTGSWVRVRIANTGLDIDGVTLDSGCFVASVTACGA